MKIRFNKGQIVQDENTNRKLRPYIQKAGYKVISISPSDRNCRLTDPSLIKKYCRLHPLVTTDYTLYSQFSSASKLIGAIEIEPCPPEQLSEYGKKLQTFLENTTEKGLKYKVQRIPIVGEPSLVIKLPRK